jgi:hypothetical protein
VLHNELGVAALNGSSRSIGTLTRQRFPAMWPSTARRSTLQSCCFACSALRDRCGGDSGEVAAVAPPVPGVSAIWDNLQLRLRFHASNNLIIKGDNMRLSRESMADRGTSTPSLEETCRSVKSRIRISTFPGPCRRCAAPMPTRGAGSRSSATALLRFLGGTSLDPLLGIIATRTVNGVVVKVALRGQASTPELELTSSPALEESDILSLLLFNRPANELGVGQRNEVAVQAASLASGFVGSPAISAVGEKLGLDFFSSNRPRRAARPVFDSQLVERSGRDSS